jgi:Ca2+-binding EF-hand superfamily protein
MMEQVYQHPESFGKERIEKMKVAFDSFDKDGSGDLQKDEVVDLMTVHFKEVGINKKPTNAEVDEFFKEMGDGSDSIKFEQFKIFMLDNMKRSLIKPLADYLRSEGFHLEEIAEKFSWEQKIKNK